MYTAAGAGWYASLRRLRCTFNARLVPLISVFAAFCFVIMMFNLPLPGGTTGHALGVTIAAIVLGPSGAILATSIAIAIQALFFGDGGITTLGANCFNMAIAGALTGYAVYRLVAMRAPVASRRRVLAAAVAGYLAVNVSALLAAFEFGIQPLLFHDASGTPLYAPYPLRIALPAMMAGHLLVAGVAEALITAGLVIFLQSADPSLLMATSGFRALGGHLVPAPASTLRRLWITVALLMCLTPLGVLAAGTAWGEWSPQVLPRATSGSAPPAGLLKLSTVWTAPIPAYAPPFIKSTAFGYLLSAMFAIGLLMALSWIVQSLWKHRASAGSPQ
jgi:cobalt/nickel transport system permease protein